MMKYILPTIMIALLTACASAPKKISQEEKGKVDIKVGQCIASSLLGGENNIFMTLLGGGDEGGLKFSDSCRHQLDGHSAYGKCVRQEIEKGFGLMSKLEKPDAKTGNSGRNKCLQHVKDAKATVT